MSIKKLLSLAIIFILFSNCTYPKDKERKTKRDRAGSTIKGAVIGGLFGAGLGAGIGSAAGSAGKGAAIGGATGVVVGTGVGASRKNYEEEEFFDDDSNYELEKEPIGDYDDQDSDFSE